jgi:hypothetical protein
MRSDRSKVRLGEGSGLEPDCLKTTVAHQCALLEGSGRCTTPHQSQSLMGSTCQDLQYHLTELALFQMLFVHEQYDTAPWGFYFCTQHGTAVCPIQRVATPHEPQHLECMPQFSEKYDLYTSDFPASLTSIHTSRHVRPHTIVTMAYTIARPQTEDHLQLGHAHRRSLQCSRRPHPRMAKLLHR